MLAACSAEVESSGSRGTRDAQLVDGALDVGTEMIAGDPQSATALLLQLARQHPEFAGTQTYSCISDRLPRQLEYLRALGGPCSPAPAFVPQAWSDPASAPVGP